MGGPVGLFVDWLVFCFLPVLVASQSRYPFDSILYPRIYVGLRGPARSRVAFGRFGSQRLDEGHDRFGPDGPDSQLACGV